VNEEKTDRPGKRTISRRAAFVLLVAICVAGAALMFIRLGFPMLWVDEADTACIARNILTRGLPVCWDHGFLIEAPVTKYAAGYVWNQHPWLMHYLMAGSFAGGGATPFAARFPFALLGLASVWLTYLLARRAGTSRGAALTAAALLVVNVQFILFARQARYFSLLPFFTLILFIGFLRFHKRSGFIMFILGAVGLFHSHYLTFFPLGAVLVLWTLLFNRALLRRLLVALAIILVATIPWMFLANVFQKRELVREFTAGGFMVEVKEYAAKFNRRIFPAVFALIIVGLALGGFRRHLKFHLLVLFASLACVIFVVPISVVRSLRYLVGLFPLLAVCAAMMFEDMRRWSKPVAAVGVALFICTHVWSEAAILPSAGLRKIVGYERDFKNAYLARDRKNFFLRVEFADLYRDLRYGFQHDPLAHFIELVQKKSRDGDLVVTPRYGTQVDFYANRPAMAYYNWQSEGEKGFKIPDGYLRSPEGFERIWYMKMPSVYLRDFEEWMWRGESAGNLRITVIISDTPDIAVGNDPDLDTRLHTRENLEDVPRVVFYFIERIKSAGRAKTAQTRSAVTE